MAKYNSASDVLSGIHSECVGAIQSGVRELLETKHLYQSVNIDVTAITKKILEPLRDNPNLTIHFSSVSRWTWKLNGEVDLMERLTNPAMSPAPREFLWTAPDIKTYCQHCNRIEPFNLDSSQTILPRSGGVKEYFEPKGKVQIYSLSYLCQSCKLVPEVFTLRRIGSKLQLCGRAPMEAVSVPKYIPTEISKYFSGAQVAFQSGQTLAGLFMLRTTCEQWVRGYANENDKADVALERYAESLPTDFSDRFPSLKAVYGKLSDALHRVEENEELFHSMSQAICEHFEARKVFKLAGPISKRA